MKKIKVFLILATAKLIRSIITLLICLAIISAIMAVSARLYLSAERYITSAVASTYRKAVHSFASLNGYTVPIKIDPRTRMQIIEREAKINNVPLSLALAVIDAESNNEASATSHAGAIGLMQVMPFWAEHCGHESAQALYNEEYNIECGMRILSYALRDNNRNVLLALHEYNGGAKMAKNPKLRTKENREYPQRVLSKLK